MGKGDKRTRRGKIFKGSYGARRPHRPRAGAPATAKAPPPSPAPVPATRIKGR